MYKILKNTIEMDDYSVQKLSNLPPEPFDWNTVEGTELNVSDCIGGKGKIEVKGNTEQEQLSGKNLFGISDYEKTYNGVQIKIKDGEITLNGTCTGTGTVYIGPKDEQILNGTYTISRNSISGTMSGSGNINLRNVSDDSIISGTQMSLTINSRTFTLENANVEYGIYLMRDATFDNYKFRPQLVEGDTPDYDFEPYCGGQASPNPDYPQEIEIVTGNNVIKNSNNNGTTDVYNLNLGNIELCKIGNYQDILFKNVAGDENYNAELEDGAWYKKKVIDKKVLDDLWEWFMPTTNRFHVNITLPDGEYDLVALCDKFINALYWTTHINTDKSFIVHNGNWGNNMCRISFVDKNCASLAEWTQFVSENNLIVYHRLLNPTFEKITDTTLKSQLEDLRKAKWFKGVNHFWTETDNLEPVLKGTYRQAINE